MPLNETKPKQKKKIPLSTKTLFHDDDLQKKLRNSHLKINNNKK